MSINVIILFGVRWQKTAPLVFQSLAFVLVKTKGAVCALALFSMPHNMWYIPSDDTQKIKRRLLLQQAPFPREHF